MNEKSDCNKVVLHARHCISNTDHPSKSFSLESLATQPARANKNFTPTYAHASLDDETIDLTGFSSGDNFFAFNIKFYGIKVIPSSLHNKYPFSSNIRSFENLRWLFSYYILHMPISNHSC